MKNKSDRRNLDTERSALVRRVFLSCVFVSGCQVHWADPDDANFKLPGYLEDDVQYFPPPSSRSAEEPTRDELPSKPSGN